MGKWAHRQLTELLYDLQMKGGYGTISFQVQNNIVMICRMEATIKRPADFAPGGAEYNEINSSGNESAQKENARDNASNSN